MYDPTVYLETPEQARKLIKHLSDQLAQARRARNSELISELEANLERVEALSRDFFRWERNNERSLQTQEMREIKKMPIGL